MFFLLKWQGYFITLYVNWVGILFFSIMINRRVYNKMLTQR
nr:MAG TPA: hypothetical protein [Caudoviricetes sp.]